MSLELPIDIIGLAVSEIDGGCGPCITGFLDKLPLDKATEIVKWINENNPVYGKDLVYKYYYDDEYYWHTT